MCTRFQQRQRRVATALQRRQRPRGDDIRRCPPKFFTKSSIRTAWTIGRRAGDADRLAQEGGLFAVAFDQMDLRAGSSASAQAMTSPGKAAAGAEIDPDLGVRRQIAGAAASRRCAGSRWSGWSTARSGSSCAASAAAVSTKRSSRAAVSRETGVSSSARRGLSARSAGLRHRLRVSAAARRPSPALRTCATSSVSAAGVMPSIRPAWPMVRGRTRDAASAGPRWKGPAARRNRGRPAARSSRRGGYDCDVGGLPRQIDVVFGVDLELLGDLRRELAELAARSARGRPIRCFG